jgi:hypothetical protein
MRRSWPMFALAALAAGVGGGTTGASASSVFTPDHGGPRHRGPAYFAIGCGFSHRNNDDAIVSPGRRGVSHDHTYFGSTRTNAFSTPASLRQAGTTCALRADTAAYWVPTLFVGDRAVNPLQATAFYVRRTSGAIRAFPAGLKIVAGNAGARRPQSLNVTFWSCGRGPVSPSSAAPTCESRRSSLRLQVNFPNCWNGRSLDSEDHQSHMAYSAQGNCPASHPVAVPALALVVRYPIAGGTNVELASGGQFSGHADFVNAWHQRTLERLVDRYLNRFR